MYKLYDPPPYRLQPEPLEQHTAKMRTSIDEAVEVLKREPRPDTFLGRQHFDLVPLPEHVVLTSARLPLEGRIGWQTEHADRNSDVLRSP